MFYIPSFQFRFRWGRFGVGGNDASISASNPSPFVPIVSGQDRDIHAHYPSVGLRLKVRADGSQMWLNCHNAIHRNDDYPAILFANGTRVWYKNGIIRRDHDLPAVCYADGSQWWYRDGKIHRDDDLPAVILADGTQLWFIHGDSRRIEGRPTVVRGQPILTGYEHWIIE